MPWGRACRRLIGDYEVPMVMEAEWTLARNVRGGVEEAGFKEVEFWEEELAWRWESAEALAGYFFRGGQSGEWEDD